MTFRKKIMIWGTLAAVLYVLLSYHFIFFGRTVKVLKKSDRTLECTFFSVHGKTNSSIVAVDSLRKDGIADLMVEMGRMKEEEKEMLMARYGNASR